MKATMASILYFSNRRTMLVHFVLLPLVNELLLIALSRQFLDRSFWGIATASVLTSGCLMLVGSLAASFTQDRSCGIDREMLSWRSISFYYWGCKMAVCSAAALALIAIHLALLFLAGCDHVILLKALCAIPQILFSGISVGFFCAIGAWGSPDPYRLSNVILSFGNVLSGAAVMISAYPPFLKPFAVLFPLANTLSALHGQPVNPWQDALCAAVWLLLGLVLYRIQAKRIRAQSKFSIL